jgi:predicted AlkP superfamily pyrophosphatase or phosphodiesterase
MATRFKFFISLLACIFFSSFCFAQDTIQHIINSRTNSAATISKPYVILISADGFRADLAERYNASNLVALSRTGVAASSMKPSFPSLTFPNHYAIITGMYPSHNGLVGNAFYDAGRKELYRMNDKKKIRDSSWYGGTPLWVLAEKQQMLSASFYWVASDVAIQNVLPTYYYSYAEVFKIDRRLQLLKEWLELPEDKRPHFITFYFPEVDHNEHKYGVDSREARAAVAYVDSSVGLMNSMVKSLNLPVNFIFVSDHGMAQTDTARTLRMPAAIDTSKFIVPPGDAFMQIYAKNKADIKPLYRALKKEAGTNYKVYTKYNFPKRLHYGRKDDRYGRIADIILLTYPPLAFNFSGGKSIGRHGYDNALPEMQATFYAWGPAFKTGLKIGNFENVNVYPLVADILGLTYDHSIDGKVKVLHNILK